MNNISSFYKSPKGKFSVYGVKEKKEGFYVVDKTDEFADPLTTKI
jgi:hypothetical protein